MAERATPEQLFAEFGRLGIAHRTLTHPPVFTVDEAKALRGSIAGGHTKNLFLKDKKDRLFLAVTLEDVPVDLKNLGTEIGASGRLSFASPELLRIHLGVEPGSVTPFALINDSACHVQPILDEAMLAVNPLSFHPLANTSTTTLETADLLKFIKSQGHVLKTLHFPRRTEAAIG